MLHVTCYFLHVTCSPNVPPSGVLGTSTTVLTSFVKLSDNISKDSELAIIHCLHRTILYYLSQSKPEVYHIINVHNLAALNTDQRFTRTRLKH